jgi:aquaporin Z
MDARAFRVAIVELVGVFGLVFFSAGVICVNQATASSAQQAGHAPLTLHQPGVFGVALAQGLMLGVLLALTVPVSGGYLNPAITLTQWAFGRLESRRVAILIAAQVVGAVLAAGCLRIVFDRDILQTARFGAPHLNALAYPILSQSTVIAGSVVELLLTFFLDFAIFAAHGSPGDPLRTGVFPGMVQTAAVLVGFPLTGAALNPVRWFGPVLWDSVSGPMRDPASGAIGNPWADFLVYLSGPILGALLAGLFCGRVMAGPAEPARAPSKK